ncbi:MAG: hypothetical protein KF701_09425 [Anaerolineales bacterium]|nr:hypothetical protein [Anaerolineales bacterium]QYK50606.1 MAG: hypothetical protein KF701_09425 [Anaerolineales bacterium]
MAQGTATSDDKLWAALAYLFTPLAPVILLLIDGKKDRPFIKEHLVQALVWGIVSIVLGFVLGATIILACVAWAVWIPQIIWAYQAYQGKSVTIPVITDFVKNQGWA